MKYKIHNGLTDDYVIIEANTHEELQKQAEHEVKKRGWKDPWSETVNT